MGHLLSSIPLGVVFAIIYSVSISAQELKLTLDQVEHASRQALIGQNYQLANRLSFDILQIDPNNVSALVVRAATDPQLGNPKTGGQAGRRAFALAKDPLLKFEAAYFTAIAAAQRDKFASAKLWLRRAHQFAPNDVTRENTAQQFRLLRARDPLQVRLSFTINQTSNINGGSESEFLEIDGIPITGALSQTAQALSGIRVSTGVQLNYKLHEDQRQRTSLGFSIHSNNHIFSSSAKAAIKTERQQLIDAGFTNLPDITRASDFDSLVAEVSISHRRVPSRIYQPDGYSFGIGTTLYGGSKLYDFVRFNVERTVTLTPKFALQIAIGTTKLFHDVGARNQSINRVAFTSLYGLKNGSVVRAGFEFAQSSSDDTNRQYVTQAISLNYQFAEAFGPVKLDMGVRIGTTKYDAYFIGITTVPGGRSDDFGTLTLGATFPNVRVYGFNPRVSTQYRRTKSNISRFEQRDWSYNIGIISSF
ncbi:MAG: surface lipoprotein assembly modifier [Litoreibacter sp.]